MVNSMIKTTFFKLLGYVSALFLLTFFVSPLIYRLLQSAFFPNKMASDSLDLPLVLVESFTLLGTVWLASWFATRQLDRRPFYSLGLRFYPKALHEIGIGFLIGGLLLFALWGIDSLWLLFDQGAPISLPFIAASWEQLPGLLAFMGLIAINEELLVRGYPLQVLIRHVGAWPAILVTSVVFGLLHVVGDAWNAALVVLDTGFGGALFALAYVKTRALWMPMALHFSNNAIIFLFENPDLEKINFVPPEMAQALFWNWWLVNFPLHLMALFLLWRWRYKPDARMEAIYQKYIVLPPEVRQEEF